jgi:hypothetical protein
MALTEELTFRLGDTGTILNTDSTSIPFVDVDEVVGLDNAPYRETHRDHEGADGGFIDAEFERGRDVILNGTIIANSSTMEAYLDTLKAEWAPSPVLLPFYLKAPGVVERVLFVKPLGCKYNWTRLRRTGQSPVQFRMFAEDPRLYDATATNVVIPFTSGGTSGFGFNLGFSFGFGGSGSGIGGAFVTNSGNRPTPPIFVITGPCDTPSIADDTYGHSLSFTIVLGATDTLTIDVANRTVRLNNSVSRRNTLVNPDWFFLEPGQTFIRYNAVSGVGSSLSVTFRSAWR